MHLAITTGFIKIMSCKCKIKKYQASKHNNDRLFVSLVFFFIYHELNTSLFIQCTSSGVNRVTCWFFASKVIDTHVQKVRKASSVLFHIP